MGISPDRFRLYNKTGLPCQARDFALRRAQPALVAVLLLVSLGLSFAQIAKKRPVSKGPRAVALIQLADNGRAHLIPVTIMINGNFYDASVYKADPVPMALQPGTVYEGVKAGVSQGLFTLGGAAQANGNWFGDGKWVTAEQITAEKEKSEAGRKAQDAPKPDEEIGGPPKLKRAPEPASDFSFLAVICSAVTHFPSPNQLPFAWAAPPTVNSPCETPAFTPSYTVPGCNAMGTGSAL